MLVVPTQRTIVERINDKEVARILRSDLYLLPARLDMKVDLKLQDEPRYVGIYAVPVYLADVQFKGEFDFAALQPLLGRPGVTYLWHESRLRLPLSHVRSLRDVSEARFAEQTVKLGPARPGVYRGIEASVDLTRAREDRVGSVRISRSHSPAAAACRYCRSAARRRCNCIRTGRIRRSTARSCRRSARSRQTASMRAGRCWS